MGMGTGSIQLARLFGIRIGASPSWFFVLFIMIYMLSGYFREVLVGHSDTTAYVVAVAGTLLFFLSLIMHELGHALVARRSGIGISGIDLWFFGGLAKLTRDTSSPGEEFRVAAAGPAVSCQAIARVMRPPSSGNAGIMFSTNSATLASALNASTTSISEPEAKPNVAASSVSSPSIA